MANNKIRKLEENILFNYSASMTGLYVGACMQLNVLPFLIFHIIQLVKGFLDGIHLHSFAIHFVSATALIQLASYCSMSNRRGGIHCMCNTLDTLLHCLFFLPLLDEH